MSKSRNLLITTALAATLVSGPALAGKFGLGRPALPEEVAAWDKDVAPDGTGLPKGSGDVLTGEEVFAEKCAICHGDFAGTEFRRSFIDRRGYRLRLRRSHVLAGWQGQPPLCRCHAY